METNKNYMQEWESLFIQFRPFLISFTFRMTGSLSEAEDIVQDTFIESSRTNPADIHNPKSWLTKICSNRSLDLLKSAHKRRETYPGTWLPDAVPESFQFWGNLEQSESPDKNLTNRESLTTSFLLLIQKLNPEERVVYILTEVFDYSFKEISEFLNKSEEACRKIAQRARKAFENQTRFNSYSRESDSVIKKFFDTAKTGSAESLIEILSDDSEFWSDGGGKVSVFSPDVITDTSRIAKLWTGLLSSKLFQSERVRVEMKHVNNLPGLVISKMQDDGEWMFDTILSFEVKDQKIARIYAQRNPDKLSSLLSFAAF